MSNITNTFTLFRDNKDDSVSFKITNKVGGLWLSCFRNDNEDRLKFELDTAAVHGLLQWANELNGFIDTDIELRDSDDNRLLVGVPTTLTHYALKVVRTKNGTTRTLLMLDDHQAERFVEWLERMYDRFVSEINSAA